jgi:5,10-methylenetetrahydrofolate reductase
MGQTIQIGLFGLQQAAAREILRARGDWPYRSPDFTRTQAACDAVVLAAHAEHWGNAEQFEAHLACYLDGAERRMNDERRTKRTRCEPKPPTIGDQLSI